MSLQPHLPATAARGETSPPDDAEGQSDGLFSMPLATRIALFGNDALLSSLEWAAMRGVSDRVNQRERYAGEGCPYILVSARRVAYRYGTCKEYLMARMVGTTAAAGVGRMVGTTAAAGVGRLAGDFAA